MLKAKVIVNLKPSILDPQGSAVERSLRSMGYPTAEVRIGKYMEVTLAEDDRERGEQTLNEICQKLLANPVTEEYRFWLSDSRPEDGPGLELATGEHRPDWDRPSQDRAGGKRK